MCHCLLWVLQVHSCVTCWWELVVKSIISCPFPKGCLIQKALIWLLVSLETWDGFSVYFSNFSSSFNDIDGVLSCWASCRQSFDQGILNSSMFCILMFALIWFPVEVSGDVSFVMNGILKVLEWTLSVASQWISEYSISIQSVVVCDS